MTLGARWMDEYHLLYIAAPNQRIVVCKRVMTYQGLCGTGIPAPGRFDHANLGRSVRHLRLVATSGAIKKAKA
jgi:hypothetical protein